jgi:hypothetical protein
MASVDMKIDLSMEVATNGQMIPALYLFKVGCVSPPLLAKVLDDRHLRVPTYQMWCNPLRDPVAAGAGRGVAGVPVVVAVRVEEEEVAAAGGGALVEEEVAAAGGAETEEEEDN